MFKLKRIKLNKIKIVFEKTLRELVENSFLTFLGLFLIALILGFILFYQYSILAGKITPESSEKPLSLDEKTYQKVLDKWQERESNFLEAETKEYTNPFEWGDEAKTSF